MTASIPTAASIRADWDEYIDSLGPGERAMDHEQFLAVCYDTEDPDTLAVIESLPVDWYE